MTGAPCTRVPWWLTVRPAKWIVKHRISAWFADEIGKHTVWRTRLHIWPRSQVGPDGPLPCACVPREGQSGHFYQSTFARHQTSTVSIWRFSQSVRPFVGMLRGLSKQSNYQCFLMSWHDVILMACRTCNVRRNGSVHWQFIYSFLRASYEVSFVSYSKKNDRNISRAHCSQLWACWWPKIVVCLDICKHDETGRSCIMQKPVCLRQAAYIITNTALDAFVTDLLSAITVHVIFVAMSDIA